jgi:UrcA family protein
MNISHQLLDGTRRDSGWSKLVLMGVCSVFLTAAVFKHLPAQAADASATVSLAGLDLATDQGMQAARERLDHTARRLCAKIVNPWALSHHEDYLRCIDETTAEALGKVRGLVLVANATR